MRKTDDGFTLVELLVVVIIIGTLAAIAIPTYLKQRDGAFLASVKNDLRTAQVAVETVGIERNSYVLLDGATETTLPFIAAGYDGNVETNIVVSSDLYTYCIEGRHPQVSSRVVVVRSGVAGFTESATGC